MFWTPVAATASRAPAETADPADHPTRETGPEAAPMIAPLEWFGTADKRLWFGDWCEVTRYRTIGLLIAYAVPRSRVLVLMTRRRATVH